MLIERQQIIAKIETSDGVAVTPTGSDAVQIYDPECDDDVAFLDRRPSGASLSQQFKPPGLTTRNLTFKSDFRGSGAVATAPEWAKFAKASAMRETEIVSIALTAMASTERFSVGQGVYQGASLATATAVGICLTDLKGADGTILVAVIAGTFSTGDTKAHALDGATTATGTAATPDTTDNGFAYLPDSLRIITVVVDTWLLAAPALADLGLVIPVLRGGFVVGAIQVLTAGGGPNWATTIEAVLLWGECAASDVLLNAEAVLTANVTSSTQTRTPSLTAWNNLDGMLRKTSGARGTFTLGGEAGSNLVFGWSFTGKAEGHSAALPVVTGALGATRPPRLFGAFAGFNVPNGQFYRMPISRIEHNQGNTVGVREDVNSAGGSLGTFVTARKPALTVEVEMANTAFDAIALRNAGTLIGFGAVLGGSGAGTFAGRTAGNTCVYAAPACQILSAKPGKKNGVATWVLDLEPQKFLDAGDDEVVLASF